MSDPTGRTEMNQTSFVDVTVFSSTATPTLTPTFSQTTSAPFLLEASTEKAVPTEAAVNVDSLHGEYPSMFSASMAPPTVDELQEGELVLEATSEPDDTADEVVTTPAVFDITDFLKQDLIQRENMTSAPRGDVLQKPSEGLMTSPSLEEQRESVDEEEVIAVNTIRPDILLTASPTEPKFAIGKTEKTIVTGFTSVQVMDSEENTVSASSGQVTALEVESTTGDSDLSVSVLTETEALVDTSHKAVEDTAGIEQNTSAPESPLSTILPTTEASASTTAFPDYGYDSEIETKVLVESTPPQQLTFETSKEATSTAESMEQTDAFTSAPVTELSTFTTIVCDTDTPSSTASTTTEPMQETTLSSHEEESGTSPAVKGETAPEGVESTGVTSASEKFGTTAVDVERSTEGLISDVTDPSLVPLTEEKETLRGTGSTTDKYVPSPSMASAVLETVVPDEQVPVDDGKDVVLFITHLSH